MTALAASAPQTYGSIPNEVIEYKIADETIYEGAVLIEGAAVSSVQNHATETAGFIGIAVGDAAADERLQVKTQCLLITSINATASIGDEGTTVYAHGSNPTDIDKTSTNGAAVGKIQAVLTAGSAGANSVAIFCQADGFRSV